MLVPNDFPHLGETRGGWLAGMRGVHVKSNFIVSLARVEWQRKRRRVRFSTALGRKWRASPNLPAIIPFHEARPWWKVGTTNGTGVRVSLN